MRKKREERHEGVEGRRVKNIGVGKMRDAGVRGTG